MTTPTEPTTEAGLRLFNLIMASDNLGIFTAQQATDSILAIEAEAASAEAPLDVERLRDCIVRAAAFSDGTLLNLADLTATEYARLTAEGEH